jgi:outer membrane biosynthesis protein TonB
LASISTDIYAKDTRRIITAAVLSAVAHLFFLILVSSKILHIPAAPPVPDRMKVTLRSLERPKIVPPSEAPETDPPKETTNRGDKNTTVERETVKRGSDSPPPGAQQKQKPHYKPQPKPDQPKTLEEKKPITSAKLFLDDSFVIPQSTRASPEKKKAETKERSIKAIEPFSQGQRYLSGLGTGTSGVPDLLPGVADGAVTLLNAKADQYAVFVRRVALQVFGALKRTSWSELSLSGVKEIKDFATVEGIMSPDGKFIDARIIERSGSSSFDALLIGAVKSSLSDLNPSKGAIASDGNFHFVFQSRTWSRPGPRGEQRWLLLGTGLL